MNFTTGCGSFPLSKKSDLVGDAAEYHNKDRKDVNGDDLCEYLNDKQKLVNSEYLDSFFVGLNLLQLKSVVITNTSILRSSWE